MLDLKERRVKNQLLTHLFPEHVLSYLIVETYQKGEPIAIAGEEVAYLGILLSGRCLVKPLSSEGQEMIVGYLDPGDLIGEIELFTHRDYLHYVYADSKAEVLLIPSSLVQGELQQHLPFLHFILGEAFEKLLTRTTYFSDTRLYGHQYRTIKYIRELAERLDSDEIPFVLEEVAPFIGVCERQLRRIIRDLEAQGLVKKTYRKLKIYQL